MSVCVFPRVVKFDLIIHEEAAALLPKAAEIKLHLPEDLA